MICAIARTRHHGAWQFELGPLLEIDAKTVFCYLKQIESHAPGIFVRCPMVVPIERRKDRASYSSLIWLTRFFNLSQLPPDVAESVVNQLVSPFIKPLAQLVINAPLGLLREDEVKAHTFSCLIHKVDSKLFASSSHLLQRAFAFVRFHMCKHYNIDRVKAYLPRLRDPIVCLRYVQPSGASQSFAKSQLPALMDDENTERFAEIRVPNIESSDASGLFSSIDQNAAMQHEGGVPANHPSNLDTVGDAGSDESTSMYYGAARDFANLSLTEQAMLRIQAGALEGTLTSEIKGPLMRSKALERILKTLDTAKAIIKKGERKGKVYQFRLYPSERFMPPTTLLLKLCMHLSLYVPSLSSHQLLSGTNPSNHQQQQLVNFIKTPLKSKKSKNNSPLKILDSTNNSYDITFEDMSSTLELTENNKNNTNIINNGDTTITTTLKPKSLSLLNPIQLLPIANSQDAILLQRSQGISGGATAFDLTSTTELPHWQFPEVSDFKAEDAFLFPDPAGFFSTERFSSDEKKLNLLRIFNQKPPPLNVDQMAELVGAHLLRSSSSGGRGGQRTNTELFRQRSVACWHFIGEHPIVSIPDLQKFLSGSGRATVDRKTVMRLMETLMKFDPRLEIIQVEQSSISLSTCYTFYSGDSARNAQLHELAVQACKAKRTINQLKRANERISSLSDFAKKNGSQKLFAVLCGGDRRLPSLSSNLLQLKDSEVTTSTDTPIGEALLTPLTRRTSNTRWNASIIQKLQQMKPVGNNSFSASIHDSHVEIDNIVEGDDDLTDKGKQGGKLKNSTRSTEHFSGGPVSTEIRDSALLSGLVTHIGVRIRLFHQELLRILELFIENNYHRHQDVDDVSTSSDSESESFDNNTNQIDFGNNNNNNNSSKSRETPVRTCRRYFPHRLSLQQILQNISITAFSRTVGLPLVSPWLTSALSGFFGSSVRLVDAPPELMSNILYGSSGQGIKKRVRPSIRIASLMSALCACGLVVRIPGVYPIEWKVKRRMNIPRDLLKVSTCSLISLQVTKSSLIPLPDGKRRNSRRKVTTHDDLNDDLDLDNNNNTFLNVDDEQINFDTRTTTGNRNSKDIFENERLSVSADEPVTYIDLTNEDGLTDLWRRLTIVWVSDVPKYIAKVNQQDSLLNENLQLAPTESKSNDKFDVNVSGNSALLIHSQQRSRIASDYVKALPAAIRRLSNPAAWRDSLSLSPMQRILLEAATDILLNAKRVLTLEEEETTSANKNSSFVSSSFFNGSGDDNVDSNRTSIYNGTVLKNDFTPNALEEDHIASSKALSLHDGNMSSMTDHPMTVIHVYLPAPSVNMALTSGLDSGKASFDFSADDNNNTQNSTSTSLKSLIVKKSISVNFPNAPVSITSGSIRLWDAGLTGAITAAVIDPSAPFMQRLSRETGLPIESICTWMKMRLNIALASDSTRIFREATISNAAKIRQVGGVAAISHCTLTSNSRKSQPLNPALISSSYRAPKYRCHLCGLLRGVRGEIPLAKHYIQCHGIDINDIDQSLWVLPKPEKVYISRRRSNRAWNSIRDLSLIHSSTPLSISNYDSAVAAAASGHKLVDDFLLGRHLTAKGVSSSVGGGLIPNLSGVAVKRKSPAGLTHRNNNISFLSNASGNSSRSIYGPSFEHSRILKHLVVAEAMTILCTAGNHGLNAYASLSGLSSLSNSSKKSSTSFSHSNHASFIEGSEIIDLDSDATHQPSDSKPLWKILSVMLGGCGTQEECSNLRSMVITNCLGTQFGPLLKRVCEESRTEVYSLRRALYRVIYSSALLKEGIMASSNVSSNNNSLAMVSSVSPLPPTLQTNGGSFLFESLSPRDRMLIAPLRALLLSPTSHVRKEWSNESLTGVSTEVTVAALSRWSNIRLVRKVCREGAGGGSSEFARACITSFRRLWALTAVGRVVLAGKLKDLRLTARLGQSMEQLMLKMQLVSAAEVEAERRRILHSSSSFSKCVVDVPSADVDNDVEMTGQNENKLNSNEGAVSKTQNASSSLLRGIHFDRLGDGIITQADNTSDARCVAELAAAGGNLEIFWSCDSSALIGRDTPDSTCRVSDEGDEGVIRFVVDERTPYEECMYKDFMSLNDLSNSWISQAASSVAADVNKDGDALDNTASSSRATKASLADYDSATQEEELETGSEAPTSDLTDDDIDDASVVGNLRRRRFDDVDEDEEEEDSEETDEDFNEVPGSRRSHQGNLGQRSRSANNLNSSRSNNLGDLSNAKSLRKSKQLSGGVDTHLKQKASHVWSVARVTFSILLPCSLSANCVTSAPPVMINGSLPSLSSSAIIFDPEHWDPLTLPAAPFTASSDFLPKLHACLLDLLGKQKYHSICNDGGSSVDKGSNTDSKSKSSKSNNNQRTSSAQQNTNKSSSNESNDEDNIDPIVSITCLTLFDSDSWSTWREQLSALGHSLRLPIPSIIARQFEHFTYSNTTNNNKNQQNVVDMPATFSPAATVALLDADEYDAQTAMSTECNDAKTLLPVISAASSISAVTAAQNVIFSSTPTETLHQRKRKAIPSASAIDELIALFDNEDDLAEVDELCSEITANDSIVHLENDHAPAVKRARTSLLPSQPSVMTSSSSPANDSKVVNESQSLENMLINILEQLHIGPESHYALVLGLDDVLEAHLASLPGDLTDIFGLLTLSKTSTSKKYFEIGSISSNLNQISLNQREAFRRFSMSLISSIKSSDAESSNKINSFFAALRCMQIIVDSAGPAGITIRDFFTACIKDERHSMHCMIEDLSLPYLLLLLESVFKTVFRVPCGDQFRLLPSTAENLRSFATPVRSIQAEVPLIILHPHSKESKLLHEAGLANQPLSSSSLVYSLIPTELHSSIRAFPDAPSLTTEGPLPDEIPAILWRFWGPQLACSTSARYSDSCALLGEILRGTDSQVSIETAATVGSVRKPTSIFTRSDGRLNYGATAMILLRLTCYLSNHRSSMLSELLLQTVGLMDSCELKCILLSLAASGCVRMSIAQRFADEAILNKANSIWDQIEWSVDSLSNVMYSGMLSVGDADV